MSDIRDQIRKRLSATVGLLSRHDRRLLMESCAEIERLRAKLAAADESARLLASTSGEQIERLLDWHACVDEEEEGGWW